MPASELRARAALLIALLLRKPDDEAIAPCAQRLDELIDGESDLNVRVMAASILLNYINWNTEGSVRGRARRAHRAHPAQTGGDAADAGVVGGAVRALALHQRALCGIDRSHDGGARRRGALRARESPVRHRPPGGRCARQQGRSRGRQGASRRHGAALVADISACSGPTIFTCDRSSSSASGTPSPRRTTPNERSRWLASSTFPRCKCRIFLHASPGPARRWATARARAALSTRRWRGQRPSIARCSRSGASFCRSRPT